MTQYTIGASVLLVAVFGFGIVDRGPFSDSAVDFVTEERFLPTERSTTTAPSTAEPMHPTTPVAFAPSTVVPEQPMSRSTPAASNGSARVRISRDGTPMFAGDFADPDVVAFGGSFFAFATNTMFMNVPVLSTESGGVHGDALPVLPAWSEPHHVWAPSVTEVGDHWLLHYTTRHSGSGRQCISVAVGDHPAGPFLDESTEPLVCALDQGGAIDPSVVFDGEAPHLLWKSDGNCCGLPTVVYSQPLSSDGLALAGSPIELLRNDLSWERDVIEGPSMIEVGDTWWLFYSANRWDHADYAVGLAECQSVVGPCEKQPNPWLESTDSVAGPGGLEVVRLPDRAADLVVFHGWVDGEVGYPEGARALFVHLVRWSRNGPDLVVPASGGS